MCLLGWKTRHVSGHSGSQQLMNQLTNTNKLLDLVQTECLWDSCFPLSRPWLTFFPSMTRRLGLEIWLTARIRNYLSRFVMGGSRHGGGVGLMLAAISWTGRPDWHAVFVCSSSERESLGLQQLLHPNPALLFSQGLRGSCESCALSTVHCILRRYSQAKRTSLIFFLVFFFFLPQGSLQCCPSFSCF